MKNIDDKHENNIFQTINMKSKANLTPDLFKK